MAPLSPAESLFLLNPNGTPARETVTGPPPHFG
jgi:hypothetical protein